MSASATATLPGRILDPGTLQFERRLPVPIHTAWEYLTGRDRLKLWLADGPMDQFVGGRVDLQFENDPARSDSVCRTQGTILEWEPPTRLSYTWMEQNHGVPGEATIVVFEVAPEVSGVRLTLTHRRLNTPELHMYLAGWHTHLEVLGSRASGVEPPEFNGLFNAIAPAYWALAESARLGA